MDVVTTLAFLRKGVAEGNPLMNWALSSVGGPLAVLVATKLVAAAIGCYCHRSGRTKLLRRANAGYSLVVGWNLVGIGAAVLAR